MKKFLLISSDCHGGIPTQHYKQYMESRYHEQLADHDRWLQTAHLDSDDYFEQPGMLPPHLIAERNAVAGQTAYMDSAGRLANLEADGVVSEVVFPGAAPGVQPPWSDFLSAGTFRNRTRAARELQAVGERAYNRWLVDFCRSAPRDRRLGLAFLPIHDVKASVQECYWAAENGLRGAVFPFFNYDLPEYSNSYWEPIWSACEEARLTVNFHGGHGSPEMGEFRYLWMLEFQMWARRTMSQMIFSGVFDRHPRLYCTMTEARASWIPDAMSQFDKFVDDAHGETSVNNILMREGGASLPERRPSEYWQTNWFAGSSITNVEEMRRRQDIGIHTMMYGIDYPHPEGSWGQLNTWLSAAFSEAEVTEDEARLILGENAARLYELDIAVLAPVVERVGPTVDMVFGKVSDEEMQELFAEAKRTGRALSAASYRRDQDLSRI